MLPTALLALAGGGGGSRWAACIPGVLLEAGRVVGFARKRRLWGRSSVATVGVRMAGVVRDRSADNKMHTLGLFSDLNYTTINDPYDDVALRRMLSNRLGECRANVLYRSLAARVRESVPGSVVAIRLSSNTQRSGGLRSWCREPCSTSSADTARLLDVSQSARATGDTSCPPLKLLRGCRGHRSGSVAQRGRRRHIQSEAP